VLLLNEYLLLFISLSTQSGNFCIHSRNSTKQSPSSGSGNGAASQGIPRLLCNPKVQLPCSTGPYPEPDASSSSLGSFLILAPMWVPVTTAWRVVLRIEETSSRFGRELQIYWICSCGQSTRGGPPAWELGLLPNTCSWAFAATKFDEVFIEFSRWWWWWWTSWSSTIDAADNPRRLHRIVTKCYTG